MKNHLGDTGYAGKISAVEQTPVRVLSNSLVINPIGLVEKVCTGRSTLKNLTEKNYLREEQNKTWNGKAYSFRQIINFESSNIWEINFKNSFK